MHIVHCNTYMAMSASLVMRARVYANVCVSFNGRIAWVALACEPYSILGWCQSRERFKASATELLFFSHRLLKSGNSTIYRLLLNAECVCVGRVATVATR